MATEWDEDRILSRVEARQPTGQQELVGDLVVRLYDRGVATGRLDEPVLMFDSEKAYGERGRFDSQTKAEAYGKTAAKAFLVAGQRRIDVHRERTEKLPERLEDRHMVVDEANVEEDMAKAEAKTKTEAAREKAAKARAEIRKLGREASSPGILVDVPPDREGWAVVLAPSVSDGAEPVVLVSTMKSEPEAVVDPEGKPSLLDEVLADAAKPEKREPVESGRKMPAAVKGKGRGRPLAVASVVMVELEGDDEPFLAELTAIVSQDEAGAYQVEVRDAAGECFEVPALSCRRATKKEREGWAG